MAPRVADDVRDGIAYGVGATPTFFINGRRLVGAFSLNALSTHVDRALEQAEENEPGE